MQNAHARHLASKRDNEKPGSERAASFRKESMTRNAVYEEFLEDENIAEIRVLKGDVVVYVP